MSSRESISVPSRSNTMPSRIAWPSVAGPPGSASDALISAGVTKGRAAHEKWPHLRDELGRLPRAAHGLHHVRQRVEIFADQADHELVVIGVEPMASEAHVVGEILRAVGFADARVLTHDAAALARLDALERAGAPQRIPDGPGPRLVQHDLARAPQEPIFEVRLETARVAAAEHGVLA